jgi:hypothetical protein
MRHRGSLTRLTAAAAGLALVLGVAACSDDSDDSSASASSTTTSTTTPATSTTSTATGGATSTSAPGGCAVATHGSVPAGAASRKVGDLDGDAKADTVFVTAGEDGGKQFGVVTAGGLLSTWTADDASGVEPSVLGVVDSNQDGRPEIWVNPGRHVVLLGFTDCALQPYRNAEDQPYEFSIGFEDTGTGVGCVDVDHDGRRDLVGLKGGEAKDGKVAWTRTIVKLDGTQARNGATDGGTYTSPKDDAAIALLHDVTCGDETFPNPLTSSS